MKLRKSILSLLLVVATILSLSATTVFAAETEPTYQETLPEDAVIIYQGDDGIVYQSKTGPMTNQSNSDVAPAASNLIYSGHRVTKSTGETSSYTIENTYSGTCYGTFKVTETDNNNLYAYMQIIAPSGRNAGGVIKPYMGDVYFTLYNGKGTCVIEYSVAGPAYLNCWLYQNKPSDYYDRTHLNE